MKINIFQAYIEPHLRYTSNLYYLMTQQKIKKANRILTISIKKAFNLKKQTNNKKLLYCLNILNFENLGISTFLSNYLKLKGTNLILPTSV